MHKNFRLSTLALALLFITRAQGSELPVLQGAAPSGVYVASDDLAMMVMSSKQNNVLKWKSFNVSEDAMVSFDQKNYLNLVTGGSPSLIEGHVQAFGNLYIVNPAGITTGLNAAIQSKKLGLITGKLDEDLITSFEENGSINAQNVAGMGRVNLLGEIKTENLQIDAGQIVIRAASNLKTVTGDVLHNRQSEKVRLKSSVNRIDIGGISAQDLKTNFLFEGDHYYTHEGETPISNKEEFLAIANNGRYFLTNDIDLGEISSSVLSSFNGSLDGAMSHLSFKESSGAKAFQGLFGTLDDATLNNLFLKASTNIPESLGIKKGALAGTISNSNLENISLENTLNGSVAGTDAFTLGGLAGEMSGSNNLTNVIVSTKANLENSDLLFGASGITFGTLAGLNLGVINSSGLVGGILNGVQVPENASIKQIGLGNDLTADLKESLEALDESHKDNYIVSKDDSGEEITAITDKRFYDPFFTENFSLDSDEQDPDYKALSSNTAFKLANFVETTLDTDESTTGKFVYKLQDKGNSRGYYFINTKEDGTKSSALSGRGIITTTAYQGEVEPEPTPEPTPDPGEITDPEPTPQPTPDPEEITDPDPTPQPTPDPEESKDPDPTPEPTPDPEETKDPDPTPEPTPDPEETTDPEPTPDPEETKDPDPTPEPTPDPEETKDPDPTPEPNPDPEETKDPEPTPEPTPDPEETTDPDPTPEPTPNPEETKDPDPTPEPTPNPKETTEPTPTPEPTPEPEVIPDKESTTDSSPKADNESTQASSSLIDIKDAQDAKHTAANKATATPSELLLKAPRLSQETLNETDSIVDRILAALMTPFSQKCDPQDPKCNIKRNS